MNRDEALSILKSAVDTHKDEGYATLKKWAEARKVETLETTGNSGTEYQIELTAFWDDKKDGPVRFSGYIDSGDSGLKNLLRSDITYSFIMRPDGSLVE
jgi:hypothetical protein